MNEPQTPQEMLSQAVEREVRFTIGELTMQTIVLRQALNMAQQQPQPGDPRQQPIPPGTVPHPMPRPEPIPPQPEHPEPKQRIHEVR